MATKPKAGPGATTGLDSVGAMVQHAIQAQERALEVTQSWSESTLDTFQEQAESYGTMLRSVDVSLQGMEQAIKSQADATKALAESLESSRQVVSSVMGAQQDSGERVESLIVGMLDVLKSQFGGAAHSGEDRPGNVVRPCLSTK